MQSLSVSTKHALIIVPPLQDFYLTPHRMSSLGAHTVQRVLVDNGYSVTFIDGITGNTSGTQLSLPPALAYLKPHLIPHETGRCSFLTRFRHFGKTYREIISEIEPVQPELCFICCFAFCYGTPVLELADALKRQYPHMVIIAGGAGVSVYPEYFLRRPSIDYTLCGEAEVTLPLFLKYIEGTIQQPDRVPNLGCKEQGTLKFSPLHHFTDKDTLLPVIRQTPGKKDSIGYTTALSRGCPASCRFCSNHLTHGKQFRHCTIEAFEKMLSSLPANETDHPVQINFEDDNLLYDYPFLLSVIDRCKEKFRNVRFFAENGLDYRLLPPDRCRQLIDAGFCRFNFTLGSVSSTVLETEQRSSDVTRYDQLLSVAATAGIPVLSYLICGLPDDTKSTIAGNLRFLQNRKTIIGMSMFYPVPGLAGFEKRSVFDALSPQLCAGSSAYSWCGSVDTETLVTAFRLARFVNLVKEPVVTEEERMLIERTVAKRKLHTMVKERGQRRIIEVPGQDGELAAMVLMEDNGC